ncbi:MAG: collagen binding domain-containing protein, partial [Planctomycetota bacterium]
HRRVRVGSKGTGEPGAGAKVFVKDRRMDDFHPLAGREKGSTGKGGSLDVPVAPGVDLWVGVQPPDSGGSFPIEALRNLTRLAPGETRTLLFEMIVGKDLPFFGRVVDARDDTPVAGAEIQLFGSGRKARTFRSSREGTFDLPARSTEEPHIQVRAAGFAPGFVVLKEAPSSPAEPFLVRLRPSAALFGRVLGPRATQAGTEIEASAPLWAITQPKGASSWTFEEVLSWRAETDAQGNYRLSGLPSGIPLTLVVTVRGLPPFRDPVPRRLEAGQESRADWNLQSLATLHGRVLDRKDHPVAGLPVLATQEGGEPGKGFLLFLDHLPNEEVVRGTTGPDGTFLLKNLFPGRWTLAVDARSKLPPSLGDVSPAAARVVIPPGSPDVPAVLRTVRGLFLSGSVEEPSGDPADRILVLAEGLEGQDSFSTRTDSKGSFRLGPLLPGFYRLKGFVLGGHPSFGDSDPVQAKAGREDVVLKLSRVGILRGIVVDGDTGRPARARILLTRPDAMPFRGERVWPEDGESGPDGAFVVEHLPSGIYTVHAEGREGGSGILFGVKVDSSSAPGNVKIELHPDAVLVVQVLAPLRAARLEIGNRRGIFHLEGIRRAPEKIRVPPGELTVALLDQDQPIARRQVPVAAGERKEIVFEGGD